MKLNPYDIDMVKQTSCVDILRENGVAVDRYGKAVCPFHGDKNKSFCYYPKTNTCHCFGCGWDGDSIRLTMAFTGLGFFEAYKYMGGRVEELNEAENERLKRKHERLEKWREWIARCHDEISRLNLAVIAIDWDIKGLDVLEVTDTLIALERKKMRMLIEIENYKDTLQKLEKELENEKSNRHK